MNAPNRYRDAGTERKRGPENLESILRKAPRFFRAKPWRPQ